MNKINQEYGAEQDRLGRTGPVRRKGHAEVVGVGKAFLKQAGPIFGNFAQRLAVAANLKRPGTQYRAEQLAQRATLVVIDVYFRRSIENSRRTQPRSRPAESWISIVRK